MERADTTDLCGRLRETAAFYADDAREAMITTPQTTLLARSGSRSLPATRDEFQRCVVALQPFQLHLRERGGSHFFRGDQLSPFVHVCKRQRFGIFGHALCRDERS